MVNLAILVGRIAAPALLHESGERRLALLEVATDRQMHHCKIWDELAARAGERDLSVGNLICLRGRIETELMRDDITDCVHECTSIVVTDYEILVQSDQEIGSARI